MSGSIHPGGVLSSRGVGVKAMQAHNLTSQGLLNLGPHVWSSWYGMTVNTGLMRRWYVQLTDGMQDATLVIAEFFPT